jgi:hypothetical protein
MTPNDATLISLLAGVLIPLLVGLLTKLEAPSGVKAVMNAALSALSGALATIAPDGSGFSWKPFLVFWATTWVVSIATYAGLWKPTGVAPAVQRSTGSVGIG